MVGNVFSECRCRAWLLLMDSTNLRLRGQATSSHFQKHQHLVPDTTRPDAPRTRSSSLDFIQQKLRRLTVRSSGRGHESEASVKRGPLGLNLLYQPSDPHINFIFVRGHLTSQQKSMC